MAKEIGADRLGDFYTNGKVRKRREWRGLKDTMYDYKCWLGIMGTLAGFIIKPRNRLSRSFATSMMIRSCSVWQMRRYSPRSPWVCRSTIMGTAR